MEFDQYWVRCGPIERTISDRSEQSFLLQEKRSMTKRVASSLPSFLHSSWLPHMYQMLGVAWFASTTAKHGM